MSGPAAWWYVDVWLEDAIRQLKLLAKRLEA
jgi:hypothetical protein